MAATHTHCPLDGKLVAVRDSFEAIDHADHEEVERARQFGHVCTAADADTFAVPGWDVPELRDLIGAELDRRRHAGTADRPSQGRKATTMGQRMYCQHDYHPAGDTEADQWCAMYHHVPTPEHPSKPAGPARPARLRIERSTNLPAGAVNRWHVYDFDAGQVARRTLVDAADGRLAYFRTRREAQAFVTDAYLAECERERAARTPAEQDARERETFGRL